MMQGEKILGTSTGFKRFFTSESQSQPQAKLHVRGIGIREVMPPCLIDRPLGTRDYLIMLFHDPFIAGSRVTSYTTGAPGMIVIWPPRKSQYYGHTSQRFAHSWIHCDGTRVRAMLRSLRLPKSTPFLVPDPSRFQQCLLEIHGEMISYLKPDTEIMANLLENFLRSLSRDIHADPSTHVPENLLAVRRIISARSAEPLTLSALAKTAGMSPPYFSLRFKEVFGISPMEYLIQHRMDHAAHLLGNRNLNIGEIAATVGYGDLFHFSKMFKKHFGVSPREMRQRQERIPTPKT